MFDFFRSRFESWKKSINAKTDRKRSLEMYSKQMEVSESLRKFVSQNIPEKLFGEPARTGIGGKTKHVYNVVRLGERLVTDEVNPELLKIALQLHDIGRSVQWNSTESFDDRVVNLRYIALQMVEQFIRNEKCEITTYWMIIADVMQYHGVPHMYGFVCATSMPYVKLVSLADDIENGCNGALGYLEDEKARDDKGYIKEAPERDQRDCNPELFGYLERGEKFNKMALCHTYAEYFVFAAMLAVNACINAGEIAKEAMKDLCYCYEDENGEQHWLDAVEGYCHIFEEHLHPEDAKIACEIMRKMCR